MRVIAKIFFLVVSCLFVVSCKLIPDETSVNITFVGDLLLDRGVRQRIINIGEESLFKPDIDSVFSESDYVVANLECPATKINQPINKRFIFRAEPEWLKTLRVHGITHLNMANNHSMDQGRKGLFDTYKNICKYGMIPVGYGDNYILSCKPVLICSEPRNVYLLSSVMVPSENWVFLNDKPCVCEATVKELAGIIKKLKSKDNNAVVILQLHWGAENTLKPVISQKQQAHQLVDAGVDVIIGHHTHTIQTIENYKGKSIFYSIGNFIFDAKKPINKKGLLVQLKVTNKQLKVSYKEFEIDKCSPEIVH